MQGDRNSLRNLIKVIIGGDDSLFLFKEVKLVASILLSIKPEYVEKILKGEKRYEFRRKLCQKEVDKIYIYETSPVKKVVGEAVDIEKLQGDKEMIWEQTKGVAGVTREGFDQYFADMKTAGAYYLGKVKVYETARDIKSFGISAAPQSFVYVEEL